MRLINTTSLELETFSGEEKPPYAILSHTWLEDRDEVTFQEFQDLSLRPQLQARPGFRKIQKTCQLARDDYGLPYAWVDTCAVDKTSSTELSEAINSMFNWYREAEMCIIYLSDLDGGSPISDRKAPKEMKACRWFARGWTLQELIAPRQAVFYNKDWHAIGRKSDVEFANYISDVTEVNVGVLLQLEELADVPVGVRMSWASHRTTKRPEDQAYCLFGLFDVNMPLLYGEGARKAFMRLQEEIIKDSPDMSIFAWTSTDLGHVGMLAPSPLYFCDLKGYVFCDDRAMYASEHTITNRGLQMLTTLGFDSATGVHVLWTSIWHPEKNSFKILLLRQIGINKFVRIFTTWEKRSLTPNGKLHKIRIPKVLTDRQARIMQRSYLQLGIGSDLKIEDCVASPIGSFNPAIMQIVPDYEAVFECYLTFSPPWAGEYDSFIVVCQCHAYRGGGWAFSVVTGDEWVAYRKEAPDGIVPLGREQFDFSSTSKRLLLHHLFDETARKVVHIKLQAGGHEHPTILDLSIEHCLHGPLVERGAAVSKSVHSASDLELCQALQK